MFLLRPPRLPRAQLGPIAVAEQGVAKIVIYRTMCNYQLIRRSFSGTLLTAVVAVVTAACSSTADTGGAGSEGTVGSTGGDSAVGASGGGGASTLSGNGTVATTNSSLGGSGAGGMTSTLGGSTTTGGTPGDASTTGPGIHPKAGFWSGITSDATVVSFRVSEDGTQVTRFRLNYRTGCETDATWDSIDALIVAANRFDSADNYTTTSSGMVENPYRQIKSELTSATTARGTYFFQGATITTTEKTCTAWAGTSCADWEETATGSCVSSGQGTWEATWQSEIPVSGCGDGYLDPGEACDDGNSSGQDGCSDECTVESGFICPTVGKPCIDMGVPA